MVCTGRMAMARASWPSSASFRQPARSSAASVATTASVVLPPDPATRAAWRGRRNSRRLDKPSFRSRTPAIVRPSRPTTLPSALVTASAATIVPSSSRTAALPTPPFEARSGPASFPTVAPVPAPTLPSTIGPAAIASSQAARPDAGVGSGGGRADEEIEEDRRRHDRDAPRPASRRPRPARRATASRRPLRPGRRPSRRARQMACTRSTSAVVRSRSVSRVPGADPRTSTPATAPSRASTTVQPVMPTSSVACPTRRPPTSASVSRAVIGSSNNASATCRRSTTMREM